MKEDYNMRYEGEEVLGMSKKEVDKQLKTQKEIKEEIMIDRNIKMPEAIWQRFQKGEVNLIDNLWNELGEMIKITNETQIKLAKTQAITEFMKIIDDFDFEKWNHKDNEYSYFGLECKGELKARLKIL